MAGNSIRTGRKAADQAGGCLSSDVLVITGLSGSGKTVALRAVEDAGFYCVDNIPVSLISSLIDSITCRSGTNQIAIGIDIREKSFHGNIGRALSALRKKHRLKVLYLEADRNVLIRRFKETRRPHPLGGSLEDAINSEKKMLSGLKKSADRIIDTTSLSPHELRRLVTALYAGRQRGKELSASLISFGFKYGIPQNIDMLFDVRFLPNPHFVPSLKELTGRDKKVADYVLTAPVTKEFLKKVRSLLTFLLPHYINEGKSYISIAFGCTGGRHRSPAIVEEVASFISGKNVEVNAIHRDIS